jgi:hypothetical protein
MFVVGILPLAFGNSFWAFGLFSELYYFAWLWVAGSFLTTVTIPSLRPKLRFFRFAVLFLALYFFVAIAIFQNIFQHKINLPDTVLNVLAALFIPLLFLAIISVLYVLYFVSKSLLLAEARRPVSVLDYTGAFFLVWFPLVGVWVVQPRINRLFAARAETV